MKTIVGRTKTRTAEIWVDDSAIVQIAPLAGVVIDKEDILDNFLVVRHLTASQPSLKIIDSRSNWKMTPEAEACFKREDTPEKTIARAVLIRSRTERFIKSLLVRLFKPEMPFDFFTSEAEATRWLLTFKK